MPLRAPSTLLSLLLLCTTMPSCGASTGTARWLGDLPAADSVTLDRWHSLLVEHGFERLQGVDYPVRCDAETGRCAGTGAEAPIFRGPSDSAALVVWFTRHVRTALRDRAQSGNLCVAILAVPATPTVLWPVEGWNGNARAEIQGHVVSAHDWSRSEPVDIVCADDAHWLDRLSTFSLMRSVDVEDQYGLGGLRTLHAPGLHDHDLINPAQAGDLDVVLFSAPSTAVTSLLAELDAASPPPPPVQHVVDQLREEGFSVSRGWHTAHPAGSDRSLDASLREVAALIDWHLAAPARDVCAAVLTTDRVQTLFGHAGVTPAWFGLADEPVSPGYRLQCACAFMSGRNQSLAVHLAFAEAGEDGGGAVFLVGPPPDGSHGTFCGQPVQPAVREYAAVVARSRAMRAEADAESAEWRAQRDRELEVERAAEEREEARAAQRRADQAESDARLQAGLEGAVDQLGDGLDQLSADRQRTLDETSAALERDRAAQAERRAQAELDAQTERSRREQLEADARIAREQQAAGRRQDAEADAELQARRGRVHAVIRAPFRSGMHVEARSIPSHFPCVRDSNGEHGQMVGFRIENGNAEWAVEYRLTPADADFAGGQRATPWIRIEPRGIAGGFTDTSGPTSLCAAAGVAPAAAATIELRSIPCPETSRFPWSYCDCGMARGPVVFSPVHPDELPTAGCCAQEDVDLDRMMCP